VTDQELKDFIASLAIESAKTGKQIKNLKVSQKETGLQIKELGKNIGGLSNSIGEDAEQFFYSSLLDKQRLGKIIFNDITPNILKKRNGETIEIDICMTNGDSVGLVEVKQNFKKKDFKQIDKSVTEFYKFYPQYKGMKIYGAIAAKIITPKIEREALQKGYFVLRQQGNHIETVSPL